MPPAHMMFDVTLRIPVLARLFVANVSLDLANLAFHEAVHRKCELKTDFYSFASTYLLIASFSSLST